MSVFVLRLAELRGVPTFVDRWRRLLSGSNGLARERCSRRAQTYVFGLVFLFLLLFLVVVSTLFVVSLLVVFVVLF